jgi:uncharacterized protein (TIGR02996 family)
MSDEAALLAAIRDEPDDDLPRLAHADWLEERGDLARARFVRVQIERARLPEDDDRQALLLAEERRLLVQHGPGWLPPEVQTLGVRFRRGHIEELNCSVPELRRYMRTVEAWPVRRLTLFQGDDRDADVFWLRGCKWLSRIESLSLPGRQGRRGTWGGAMLNSPHLIRCCELEVGEDNAGEVTSVLAGTALADRLNSLDLFTEAGGGWQEVLALPWPRLSCLRLTEGHERPELRALIESELWGRLDVIELSHVTLPSGDLPALTAAIGRVSASRLSLASWNEDTDLFGAVANAPDWGRIRDLRITGSLPYVRQERAARSRFSLPGLLNHPGAARLHRLHLPQESELALAGKCPPVPELRWLECRAGDLLDFLRSADEPPQLVGLDCKDRARTASLAWYLNSSAASRLRWLNEASLLSSAAADALASSPYLGRLATLRFAARDISAAQARAIAEAEGLPCLSYVNVELASNEVAIELTRAPGIAWVGNRRSECEGELAALRRSRYGEMDWRWGWCLREH